MPLHAGTRLRPAPARDRWYVIAGRITSTLSRMPDQPLSPEERTRQLARSLSADDPVGWFEQLYVAADRGEALVPWDRGGPNPMLISWAEREPAAAAGARALVVGSGLGDDAEYLSDLGYSTTAFDVSPTAVRSAQQRHPRSLVDYRVASLLDPPPELLGGFDLVLESLTVQALPEALRSQAIAQVGRFVAPAGRLLVITFARDEQEQVEGPPWPLSRSQLDSFAAGGLHPQLVEAITREDDGTRFWRALFTAERLRFPARGGG